MTRSAVALALALAAAAGPARADDPGILLAVLAVESAPGVRLDGPVRATLELNPAGAEKARTLREWFPSARAAGGRVSVELPVRVPAPAGRPAAAQRGPTFLVDYDRPEAAAFRAAVAELGADPADAALAALVDRWISHKSMTRGIDSAARVAQRREGDCSEHAVLLAAAARLAGRASRVVLGVALVEVGGEVRALGHAWAEIHDGRRWNRVDATPLPAAARYLPLGVLADEGPGFVAAAWATLSPLDVRRVVLAPVR